jgi:polysaccharide biosynthesis/export protein
VARTLEKDQVWHISLPENGTIHEKLVSVTLQPDDVITVPKKLSKNILVTAGGEFNQPGTYLLTKGARLSDLISAAGGLTQNSYFKGAAFYRKSVAKKYDERLQQLADRLEQDLLRTQNQEVQKAFDSQTLKNESIFAKQERLIEKMRNVKSQGRVAMDLPERGDQFSENPQNIILESGDTLKVPSEPSTVSIIGQVNNQNTVVYIAKYNLKDYINQAGGLTRFADDENIFIIKANGSIVPANQLKVKSGGWISGRGEKILEGHIEPGDTVYVPEDFSIKSNKLQTTKDVTQIIFQILTSVGVAVAAF